ncbi:ATP-dependent Clp protease ATP-binding subunit [Candidatus Saccharibacteria bacterium]|nr:ATP-dependent Clp protease ATP-binding subunit [Candidatus Saccharibacteria bacterium]
MPIIYIDEFGGSTDDSVARIFRRALRLRGLFPALKYDEEGALLLATMWSADTPAHNFLLAHGLRIQNLCKLFPIEHHKLDSTKRLARAMPTSYVRLLRECLDDYDGRFLTSEMFLSYLLSCQRAQDLLQMLQLDAVKLEDELEKKLSLEFSHSPEAQNPTYPSRKPPFLAPFLIEFHGREREEIAPPDKPADADSFLVNLVELAKTGKLLPLISRESEIDRLITILARRAKNNPLLLGEAGVGKTAIVEGLALRIADGSAPAYFADKTIYQVDMAAMLAGTTYRGQYEQRLKNVIQRLESDPNAIAFIDELHTIVGEGVNENGADAANILKPALARGGLSLIGATTHAEYEKTIARDKALTRRFQTIFVAEPDPATTVKILHGVAPFYAEFHKVKADPALLTRIVSLADTHIFEGRFPDKALDLLDEAAARAKMEASRPDYSSQIQKYTTEIQEWQERARLARDHTEYETAASCKANVSRLKQAKAALEKKSNHLHTLTEDHVLYALSARTKVPLAKLQKRDKTGLLELESTLNRQIIGQAPAVAQVAEVIRRAKSGLADIRRPLGSFIFLGPTGVGKTEFARVLARELFGGEQHLIRFDMSEFSESASGAKLLGSPAGYVGYQDESGFDRVRKMPHSVVLFDEIEKAHPSIWNIFLQILEDGIVQTARGEAVSFRNTIIIMTSNLANPSSSRPIGFSNGERQRQHPERLLSKKMRPELLGRFDKILTFDRLSPAAAKQIFDLLFANLEQRLSAQNIKLSIAPEVRDKLVEMGFSDQYGAREMRRVLERELEAPLANFLLAQDKSQPQISVSLANNQVVCR